MKKILSLVLALALVMALTVPAFASTVSDASGLASGTTVAATGSTSVGTIKVTVPATAKFVVNPYNLSVKVKTDGTVGDDGTASTATIISPVQRVTSESSMPLDVNISVKGTASSNVTFATASTRGATPATTKSVMLVFDIVEEAPAAAAATAEPSKWNVEQVVKDGVTSYTGFDATKCVIVSATEKKLEKVATLAATDSTSSDKKVSAVAFHFTGDATAAPKDAWTTSDTVSADIIFTFTAVNNAAAN